MPVPSLRLSAAALALSVLALAGCGGDSTTPTQPTNNPPPPTNPPVAGTSVTIGDNFFNPDNISFSAGQTVTWTWGGVNPHSVTFDDTNVGDSPTQNNGTFQKSFPTAGTFTYFCTVHGRSVMSGQVTAQ